MEWLEFGKDISAMQWVVGIGILIGLVILFRAKDLG
jgi:hypothetical protein